MTGDTLSLFRYMFPLGATPHNASGMASLGASSIKIASPASFDELTFEKRINLQKKYKFWTEPRPCMVLRPKPLGKPTTYKEEYKFWTEPRPCMVLGPKPLGKPTTYKEEYKFWTEPRP